MPITNVHVPAGSFDPVAKERAIRGLTEAVARAESIPDDPARRSGIVVIWSESPPGSVHSNGVAVDGLAVPVLVWAEPPAGVFDASRAERFVAEVDDVFRASYSGELPIVTSVIVRDVADGAWGRDGRLWRLADFARSAGYEHLQHLVSS